MRTLDIIRAWKDEDYRLSLGVEECRQLPANPAGAIELPDASLDAVAGGATEHLGTIGCCSGLTTDPGACSLACSFIQSCLVTVCGCPSGIYC